MSLLLDALKKAAEQKAEKDGKTSPEEAGSAKSRAHDETQTEVVADREATEILDETEQGSIDDTYLDREQTEAITSVDDDNRDRDEKTVILDETQTELVAGEATEILDKTEQASTDDTYLDRQQTETVIIDSEDYTDLGEETILNIFDEDQTMVLTDDDVTSFLGESELLNDETEKESLDEDLSLLLIDEENTTESSDEGPKTGSLAASTKVQILADNRRDTTSQLNLVEIPEKNQPEDPLRRADRAPDHTATTGVNLDDLTNTEGLGLQEQTSTRTYAPDNYDRTLIKVANEDASRLFSGMKSDSNVVMTPEHAKQVFVSKYSAQRMYNFRIYSAVTFGILLVIFIVGLFELQQESFEIDAKLRPLKRDPMPGVITNALNPGSSVNALVETPQAAVDTLTLQLVENAGMAGDTEIAVVEQGELAPISAPETPSGAAAAQATEAGEMDNRTQVSQPVVAAAEPGHEHKINTSASQFNETPKQILKISTSSTFSDKDRWLREAYAAYQRGDDDTALGKYNQVLKVDASNRNALLARAAIYIQNNNVAAAIRDYRALLLTNPKDSLAMASLIAVANYSPEVAESQLKIMIRDEPDSPYLNFALANVYGAQDRWIEAQSLYFTALENNPGDPNYAYNLAVSLEHVEKPEVAIAYYERALDNIGNGLATFNRDVVDQRLEKLKQL